MTTSLAEKYLSPSSSIFQFLKLATTFSPSPIILGEVVSFLLSHVEEFTNEANPFPICTRDDLSNEADVEALKQFLENAVSKETQFMQRHHEYLADYLTYIIANPSSCVDEEKEEMVALVAANFLRVHRARIPLSNVAKASLLATLFKSIPQEDQPDEPAAKRRRLGRSDTKSYSLNLNRMLQNYYYMLAINSYNCYPDFLKHLIELLKASTYTQLPSLQIIRDALSTIVYITSNVSSSRGSEYRDSKILRDRRHKRNGLIAEWLSKREGISEAIQYLNERGLLHEFVKVGLRSERYHPKKLVNSAFQAIAKVLESTKSSEHEDTLCWRDRYHCILKAPERYQDHLVQLLLEHFLNDLRRCISCLVQLMKEEENESNAMLLSQHRYVEETLLAIYSITIPATKCNEMLGVLFNSITEADRIVALSLFSILICQSGSKSVSVAKEYYQQAIQAAHSILSIQPLYASFIRTKGSNSNPLLQSWVLAMQQYQLAMCKLIPKNKAVQESLQRKNLIHVLTAESAYALLAFLREESYRLSWSLFCGLFQLLPLNEHTKLLTEFYSYGAAYCLDWDLHRVGPSWIEVIPDQFHHVIQIHHDAILNGLVLCKDTHLFLIECIERYPEKTRKALDSAMKTSEKFPNLLYKLQFQTTGRKENPCEEFCAKVTAGYLKASRSTFPISTVDNFKQWYSLSELIPYFPSSFIEEYAEDVYKEFRNSLSDCIAACFRSHAAILILSMYYPSIMESKATKHYVQLIIALGNCISPSSLAIRAAIRLTQKIIAADPHFFQTQISQYQALKLHMDRIIELSQRTVLDFQIEFNYCFAYENEDFNSELGNVCWTIIQKAKQCLIGFLPSLISVLIETDVDAFPIAEAAAILVKLKSFVNANEWKKLVAGIVGSDGPNFTRYCKVVSGCPYVPFPLLVLTDIVIFFAQ